MTGPSSSRGLLSRLRGVVGERVGATAGWLHMPDPDSTDVAVKPAPYIPVYEQLLAPLRGGPCALLELGVWTGDSLQMWRDGLPQADVVGVDLNPPQIDLGPRVHIVKGDQTDGELLGRLRAEHAPGGFDVIIDDASHVGVTTARSLQVLFTDHLKPGGLYCIEDWGTGYVGSWYDGATVSSEVGARVLDESPDEMVPGVNGPIRFPSHEIGMVGVVKRLVDHIGAIATHRHGDPGNITDPLAIASMTIYAGIVALRKEG